MLRVRLPRWAVDEDGLSAPRRGSVWHDVGLRLEAESLAPTVEAPGVDAVDGSAEPAELLYRATGSVSGLRDVHTALPETVLLELVLDCGDVALQVHAEGRASRLTGVGRLSATGRFEVVPGYEWEDFALVDTRSSWLVVDVLDEAAEDDVLVALASLGTQPGGPRT